MLNFFHRLFATDFMPHVYCLREPSLIALHAIADAVIALSYFLIPTALLLLIRRRRDLAFPWMFALFGVFILGCGATHVLGIVTLWHPIYRFDGAMKALTALASAGTAVLLFRLLPQLMLIPSPEQLRAEIQERESAEREVRRMNARLEQRVAERTQELEKANQRLAESELRLRSILDGAKALIYVKDLNGRFTFVNQAFTEFMGLRREQIIDRTDDDLFPPVLAAEFKKNDQLTLTQGSTEFEEVAQNSQGATVYVSNKFSLVGFDGQPYALCGMSTNITERKLAEEGLAKANRELRDSEERFRQIAELVPDMLWSADLDGNMRFISKRLQYYTGMNEQNCSAANWQNMIHPDDFPVVKEQIKKAAISRQSWEVETRLRRADGLYRWFMLRTAPVCRDAGAVGYWLGAFNDIDEMKRTERALRRSNEELEQFAYAAAHDLQEPLRNVSTSLGILRKQLGERITPEETEWMTESIKNARRMQTMVQDLLQYSRVVSESEQIAPLVNTKLAAEQALQNLGEAVRESQAQIQLGDLPEISVREPHLITLFQNLIGNSIKYRKPGTQPVVRISAFPNGSNWRFAVSDNGIGFDPAYSDRIFKVFKRLHNRDEYSGNGIGLALCARIVAHYGGRIWAEGQPGQGAVFQFTLPAYQQ